MRGLDRGVGPARLFGSSGGAVSALALAQRSPASISTVIAHEPPLAELLPDCDELLRETREVVATYLGGDRTGAWRQFLASADIDMPPDVFAMVFGTAPEGQEAIDERFSFAHMELPTTFWVPDLDALRAVADRLIIGIGEESTGQMCDRSSKSVASALGLDPMMFPGGHVGFVEDPAAVARTLRPLLSA